MKKILLLILLPCVAFSKDVAESALKSSTVKIIVNTKNGQKQGTGFCWKNPKYIVTALHVIVGYKDIKIYSRELGKEYTARVKNINRDADLVVLELEKDVGLVPIPVVKIDINELSLRNLSDFYISGYPLSSDSRFIKNITLSKTDEEEPKLASLLSIDTQFKNKIKKQGFPSLNVKILHIDSTIQPGNSGSPIVNIKGELVGIGDGGIRDGLIGLNWAVYAYDYLNSIENSTDTMPEEQDDLTGLYANVYEVESITNGIGQIMTLVDTKELSALINNDRIINSINVYKKYFPSVDIENAKINIYEDKETGFTYGQFAFNKLKHIENYEMKLRFNLSKYDIFYSPITNNVGVMFWFGKYSENVELDSVAFIKNMYNLDSWKSEIYIEDDKKWYVYSYYKGTKRIAFVSVLFWKVKNNYAVISLVNINGYSILESAALLDIQLNLINFAIM